MDSPCNRLAIPESFHVHGCGLIRANAALEPAKQRLEHLNEVRTTMRAGSPLTTNRYRSTT
jgi:hypothetical protein